MFSFPLLCFDFASLCAFHCLRPLSVVLLFVSLFLVVIFFLCLLLINFSFFSPLTLVFFRFSTLCFPRPFCTD